MHTGFAWAWHPGFCDGGDDGVVPIAFANQVEYPFYDLFTRAPVQTMVVSRLKKRMESEVFIHALSCLLLIVFT